MRYPETIVQKAQQEAAFFDKEKQWATYQ